jgi:hypothetical protein
MCRRDVIGCETLRAVCRVAISMQQKTSGGRILPRIPTISIGMFSILMEVMPMSDRMVRFSMVRTTSE